MFSERFDIRQPGSEFYPLWTAALGRYQCILRQGKPRIDVGILRTDHFTDNMLFTALFDEDGNRVPDEDVYGRRWMRNRENQWWQDLGMQDAGWTYEFFDGSLLLHEQVSFADGLVQPNGPGYQALIVYQSELDPDAAAHLLELGPPGAEGARRARHPRAEAPPPGTAHEPRAGRRAYAGSGRSRRGARRRPWRSCSPCPPSRRSTTRPTRSPRCGTSVWWGAQSSPARTPTC